MRIGSWVFFPRWPLVLVTLFFVAGTVSLGAWQLGRAKIRHQQFAQMQSAQNMPPIRFLTKKPLAKIVLQGVWDDAPHFLWLDNQIYQGHAGYHHYRVLRLASGQKVLVNQGWFVKVPGKPLPQVRRDASSVVVEGVLQPFPQYRDGQLPSPLYSGQVWQALDFYEVNRSLGGGLWPLWLQQTNDAADVYVRVPVELEDLSHKNRAYAIQWFSFAAIALILFFVLNVRRHVPKS